LNNIRHGIIARSSSVVAAEQLALLSVLEEVLPIMFQLAPEDPFVPPGIMVFVSDGSAESVRPITITLPLASLESGCPTGANIEVNFANDQNVGFPFRGRKITGKCDRPPQPFPLIASMTVLATTAIGPVWTVANENGEKDFYCGFALPRLPANTVLCDILNGKQFFEMLPLLHFLHEVCAHARYSWAAPTACFMIDDPNIHSSRYGYVDFVKIAERAAKKSYHVSFATIPLDGWYTHKPTAAAFRKHRNDISLLIHGNNHTYTELAVEASRTRRIGLLAQAVSRIERVERSTGVMVSRVMAPPHGACSDSMLAELPGCGFDAATIDHRSLRKFNRAKPWTRKLGYLSCENICGCPVIPRWDFTDCYTKNTILLAAYLGQPLILMGHHADLRDGLELFDGLAGFINALGPMHWSNMSELCQTYYQWCLDRNTFKVIPWSNRVIVSIPDVATAMVVEGRPNEALRRWIVSVGDGSSFETISGVAFGIDSRWKHSISIRAVVDPAPLVASYPSGCAWALTRRILTEVRDRVLGATLTRAPMAHL
jgi:hypothetical protein